MHQLVKISEEMGINPFDLEMAHLLDNTDPLQSCRDKFYIPEISGGKEAIYLCGNSLGLQPKMTRKYIEQELQNWEKHGIEGYFDGDSPWYNFDELCINDMADLVGANPIEVVLMNSLTVNLHLMLTSFYTPTEQRYKILMEEGAFPSDNIAVVSHLKYLGRDPEACLVYIKPREGEEIIREEDICSLIETEGENIALVFLGGLNYLTGQLFNIHKITSISKSKGCTVGLDLAHAVGNIRLQLHDWDVDFAVWCTYKYLNSGPGGIGGCFVHEQHTKDLSRKRLSGWWSHKKATRFLMKPELSLQDGALSFQISCPPILCLSSLKASLEIYREVGMDAFLQKSNLLTGYMAMLLDQAKSNSNIRVVTPNDDNMRGCQLTLTTGKDFSAKEILEALKKKGIICDFREPNCLRVAPNPFYNTFKDVFHFVGALADL